MNPGFEGYSGWCVWDNQTGQYGCNGAYFNSFIESAPPSHSGSYHHVHWSGSSSYDITTYQSMAAPVSGNYYASVWVTTGCDTTGTWFFIKNTDTGTTYGVDNIPACYQTWQQIVIGPAWFNQGQTIAFEMRSQNNPNQWVRFDDAALWYN